MLLPRGHDAPPELLRGMQRRGVELREVNDAASAMVALARERFLAVVLVEPGALAEAGALKRSVRRYHPRIRVWEYRADGEPRLTRSAEDDGPGEKPPEAPEPERDEASLPERSFRIGPAERSANGSLTVAEDESPETEPEAEAEAGPEDHGEPDGAMLSAEELSMLLSGREGQDREDGADA